MKTLTLKPDWVGPTAAFHHTWEGLVNIDQFRWLVRRDTQEHLKLAHDELGARHVRAVGMFDDEMRTFGLDPAQWRGGAKRVPRLNFQVIDAAIEALLEMGVAPMITTTFTPSHMASTPMTTFTTGSRTGPPRDLAEWTALVEATTRHLVDRFGAAVVRGWYFECWNEPNLRNFWDGDQAQFFALWQATWRGVKAVDPSIRLGGPSTARGEWIGEFVEYGRAHGCEPDFIITHIYNNDSQSGPLSPFEGPQEDRVNHSPHFAAGVVRGVRVLLDRLGYTGEVHWNEWGRSWWPGYPERETANEAAFVVKTMAEVSQCATRFGYWCLSDIYDQVGYGAETFHGNYGMLSLQGLRKPSYQAFQLLGRLGRSRVPIHGTGVSPLVNAIATMDERRFAVLAYGHDPAAEPLLTEASLEIALPAGVRPDSLRVFRIDDVENNILVPWRAMGSPAYLRREQRDELRAANSLRAGPCSSIMHTADGTAVLAVEMRMPGVALVEGTL